MNEAARKHKKAIPYPEVKPSVWRPTTLRKMLSQPRLAGIIVHLDEELGRSENIEPIIDEATLRKLQALAAKRAHGPGSHPAQQLLTGLAHCEVCGGTLNHNKTSKSGSKEEVRTYYRTYSCRTCGAGTIGAEALETFIVEQLFIALDDPEFRSGLTAPEDVASVMDAIARAEGELRELEAAAADLPVTAYVAKAKEIEQRLDAHRRNLQDVVTATDAAHWLTRDLEADWEAMSMEDKRTAIGAVLGPFTVRRGKQGVRLTPEIVRQRVVPGVPA
jgi:hypothetical protein